MEQILGKWKMRFHVGVASSTLVPSYESILSFRGSNDVIIITDLSSPDGNYGLDKNRSIGLTSEATDSLDYSIEIPPPPKKIIPAFNLYKEIFMRRLPVYFVLDISESMVGENIKKLEEGLNNIIRTLRQDPHALETVYVSVIAFAGKARTIVPLIEVASFYSPKLPIGGGTSLGGALYLLMSELDRSVVKTTYEHKGDWKPIVYLITDGKPTDSINGAITKWKSEYVSKATLVAIALGTFADISVLKQLTDYVFILENTREEDFKKFIEWVTNSVKSQSKSVSDEPTDSANLAKIDETLLSLSKGSDETHLADPNYVILTGRCQNNGLPYLMKYVRDIKELKLQDFAIDVTQYVISGCYPVEGDYFDWSDDVSTQLKVNTSELLGTAGCPHCGNISAFGMCSCGGIMCLNGPGDVVCPWCEKEVTFSSGGDSREGFDVNRARG